MHAFRACVLGFEIANHSNRALLFILSFTRVLTHSNRPCMHRQSISKTYLGSEGKASALVSASAL